MIASDPAGLVGRLREFDRLIALLDDAVARRGGGAVSITGEPGIGKSALVGAVTGHARASGWAVLEGRGHDLESLLAFGPLAAALGGHLHRMPRARRLAYTEGLRSLGTVVEGLGTDGPPDAVTPTDRSRVFQAVALLLGRIAADAPVLLVVDDLHWADPATVDVLRYLSGDLDALGVVLLVALRPATPRPDVRGLVSVLARSPRHEAVTLRRLDGAAVAALAADLLGGPVARPLVAMLERRSAGTPLVVQALVQDLRARGALRQRPDGWAGTEPDPDTPAHLLELFGAGLDRLPPDRRQVLELVALGGEPVPHARLAALAGDDGLTTRVDDLRAAGLLVEERVHGRVRYAPAHPLVADAALARLGQAARAALHARYVAVLEAEGAAPPDVLARHHLGARDVVGTGRARAALADAGIAALRRAAPDTALRWLTAAVDMAEGDPAVLGPLLFDLGIARQQCGDAAGALAALRDAATQLNRAGDPRGAATAATVTARLSWLRDDIAGARRSSALTLELAATADPATRAATAQAHALQLVCLGDDPAVALAVLDGTDVAAVPDAGARARLAGFERYVRMVAGHGPADGALAALRPVAPRCPDQRLELACSNARLELTVLLGRWTELDAELAAAQELGERGVGPLRSWRSPLAEFHRRFATGDWPGADDLLTELADSPWGAHRPVELHALRTWMALHRGDVPGPDGIVGPPGPDGAPLEPRGPERDLHRTLRVLAGASSGPGGGYLVMFEWWRLLACVRASAGRRALLATATDLDRLGGPGSAPAALAARARALGSAERGEAARHAALAAAAFDALGMPVDAATARIEAAERGGGRDGLAADLVLLDRLGARPLAARARDLLGRPAGAPRGPVLTPREREVAELVTDGLSNAAIAERLVVSVRTVTSHLDHVYTKLGIGSRTELAREIRSTQ
ncbi:AAA family ATPase [Pseudonocardia petroleophila]|uniref:AAA family ATPase n=1 Tax=Pseudonocardia petroleophila TaxID=37331 RepID=A0A7G7MQZ5_9PSEU|nr:LuxR family transcriptional regulator [Pseudonocardia petroleophila]QNG55206.1 AAA family ATPase [Pseudonocardia petroleophila]